MSIRINEKIKLSRRSVLLILTILILTTANLPDTDKEGFLSLIPYKDKIAHFILFGLLSVSLKFDFTKIKFSNTIIIFLCVVYGLGIELVQKYFLEYRSFELMDLAMDYFGSLFGLVILKLIRPSI